MIQSSLSKSTIFLSRIIWIKKLIQLVFQAFHDILKKVRKLNHIENNVFLSFSIDIDIEKTNIMDFITIKL